MKQIDDDQKSLMEACVATFRYSTREDMAYNAKLLTYCTSELTMRLR